MFTNYCTVEQIRSVTPKLSVHCNIAPVLYHGPILGDHTALKITQWQYMQPFLVTMGSRKKFWSLKLQPILITNIYFKLFFLTIFYLSSDHLVILGFKNSALKRKLQWSTLRWLHLKIALAIMQGQKLYNKAIIILRNINIKLAMSDE